MDICCLCKTNTNDEFQLGRKYTIDGITAHIFCAVSDFFLLNQNLFG